MKTRYFIHKFGHAEWDGGRLISIKNHQNTGDYYLDNGKIVNSYWSLQNCIDLGEEISQQKAAAIIGAIKRKNNLTKSQITNINIPNPAKIEFSYRKPNGIIRKYWGVVIEKKEDRFTAYIFGSGCRSFLYSRIIS